MLGRYNILNALAAIAVSIRLNIPIVDIKKTLFNFKGVERRLTRVGRVKNIEIIDDYAHHPTEIHNVILGIKESKPSCNLITVFQPHRYSRVVSLKKEFAKAFSFSNFVMVSDVYPAGENKPKGFNLNSFINSIAIKSKTKIEFYRDNDSLLKIIEQYKGNTTVLFVGAGSVTKWAHEFYSVLKKSYE
jgi:UDP-N-acetylmuramate--alanine ligase